MRRAAARARLARRAGGPAAASGSLSGTVSPITCLVVLERAAEALVARGAQPLDARPRSGRRPSRTGSAAPSTGSRPPTSARCPAITRWSRSSGCRCRGSRSALGELLGGRAPATPPGRASRPLRRAPRRRRAAAWPTRAGACRTRAAAARGRPSRRISSRDALSRSDARLSNSCRRPADIRCTSSARSPNSTTGILPIRRTPVIAAPGERRQRRVVGLHRDHAGRERRLDARARRARGSGGAR